MLLVLSMPSDTLVLVSTFPKDVRGVPLSVHRGRLSPPIAAEGFAGKRAAGYAE